MTIGDEYDLMTPAEITARYIYQISKGCDDPECQAPFCLGNATQRFQGRKIAATAAPALACHLASARGSEALCDQLRRKELPQNVSEWISTNSPLKSAILKNVKPNCRCSNGLPSSLVSREPFQRWLTFSSVDADGKSSAMKFIMQMQRGSLYAAKFEQHMTDVHSIIGFGLIGDLLESHQRALKCITTTEDEAFLVMCYSLPAPLFSSNEYFPYSRYLLRLLDDLKEGLSKYSPNIRALRRIKELREFVCAAAKPYFWMLYTPLDLTLMEMNGEETVVDGTYRLVSVMRHINLWPMLSAIATSTPDMDYVARFLATAHSGNSSPVYGGVLATNLSIAHFRRYEQGAMYLTELAPLLDTSDRTRLFRYGCLRQMGTTLLRLDNVSRVLSEIRSILRVDSNADAQHRVPSLRNVNYFALDVDRDDFLNSTFRCVSRALLVENLIRRPLKVRFGAGELAIDQGGVQIEFFQAVGHYMVFSDYGFFSYNSESRMAWFNPGYTGEVKLFEYLGVLFGIGVYNGCMIDIHLPMAFYKLLKGYDGHFDLSDLKDLDPALVRSLEIVEGEKQSIESVGLTFEHSFRTDEGEVVVTRLPSYSGDGSVTSDNFADFLEEYPDCILRDSVEPFIEAFRKGFQFVISHQLLNLIDVEEFQLLVEGTNHIDIDVLRVSTTYSDGYTDNSPTVRHFWSVVGEFDDHQKELLLEFVTGSRRVPIGGLSRLRFVIQRHGTDASRLPSSSVCFTRLLLPEYQSKEQLKKMLLLALDYSKGFGLL